MAFEITSANYKELIESGKTIVIDFWAEWCGPCRKVSPIIDELAEEYKDNDIIIGKCDVDANENVAIEFKVRNIPTIIFIKNKEQVDKLVGGVTKQTLQEKIKTIL